MPRISAQQLVFSRVEPDYSPKMVGGYQTVYASPSLQSEEIAFIEKRISCYQPPSENQISRKQFFCLPSKKVVITNTVVIESDPNITDKDRRTGAFIAHCLILSPSEFQSIQNNPFKVIDEFQFLTSPHDMVRSFNQKSGKEPPCNLEIDPYTGEEFDPILWTQAPKILAKVEQIRNERNSPETILLLGAQDLIEKVLRTFIQIAPLDLRLRCTFTTNVDSCRLNSGEYWAVGASYTPDGRFETIRLSNLGSLSFDSPVKVEGIYSRWLAHVAKNSPNKSALEITSAQAISTAFDLKKSIPDFVDMHISEEVYELHKNQILDILKKTVSATLSQKTAEIIIAELLAVWNINQVLTIAATGVIEDKAIRLVFRNIILNSNSNLKQLDKDDWSSIYRFGDRTKDYLFTFVASSILENTKKAEAAIEKLTTEDFKLATNVIGSLIPPAYFVSKKHLDDFLRQFSLMSFNLSDDDFEKVVISVRNHKGSALLGVLKQRVSQLDNNHLTNLENIFKREDRLSPEFAHAMSVHRKKLGRPTGMAGWFYKEK